MNSLQRLDAGPRMSEAVLYDGKLYSAGVIADAAAGQPIYAQTCDVLAQIDAGTRRERQNPHYQSHNLAGGYGGFRRNEPRMGCMGHPQPNPGPRHDRGKALRAGIPGGNDV
jgi:hypothetical protein